MKNEKTYIGNCRICGTYFNSFQFVTIRTIRKVMTNECVCSRCAAWMTRRKDPKATEEYIGGILYGLYRNYRAFRRNDPSSRHSEIYVMRLEDMSTYMAYKMVEIGRPPGNGDVRDTATLLTKREYRIVSDGLYKCHGTACLDRYTCLFYMKDREEVGGPANRIPEGWKDGDELCRSYININKANKHLLKWRKERQ